MATQAIGSPWGQVAKWGLGLVALGAAVTLFGVGLRPGLAQTVPAPGSGNDIAVKARPSYSQDVQPIFNQYCVECHTGAQAPRGLRLSSYEGVMKGSQYGLMVYSGDPETSNLLVLLKRESHSQIWMPQGKPSLSPNRIRILENWIRNGAQNS